MQSNSHDPFEHVMRQRALETFDFLLENGLPVDLQSSSGQPLLRLAVMTKCPEIIQSLLKHGADPNQTNRFGQPSLVLAASTHDVAATRLLLVNKAKVDEVEAYCAM